jgi:Domain of unknown function (DUF4160)/Protein of unknown function (DUF2442)
MKESIDYRLPRLVGLRHVREHVLWLRFSDGVQGEVDLADGLTGELLEPLQDTAEFAQARIEDGHLAWPNGADWAPESLRDRLGASYECVPHAIDDARADALTQIPEVPEISRFYGIVIRMLANEHAPPHFHAVYGSDEISVLIRDGIVTGHFPSRARRLVLEWREQHERELMSNWERLRAGQAPRTIPPLE